MDKRYKMKIYVKNNDVSKALRILKKKLLIEGDAKKLRESSYFVSKGEAKRLAKKAGIKRWAKKQIEIEKERERKEHEAYLKRRRAKNNRKSSYKGNKPYNKNTIKN